MFMNYYIHVALSFYISAPGDFAAGNMDFTLSPSRLSDCFTVRPNNDSIVEDDEQFTLRLSTTEMRVTTDPDTATITIVDNDRECVCVCARVCVCVVCVCEQ